MSTSPSTVKKVAFFTKENANCKKAKQFIPYSSRKNLQCFRLFQNDNKYLKNYTSKRFTYKDDNTIQTDCESIKNRSFYPKISNTNEEMQFPIAYAKIVFQDYLFLELEFAAEYAPQNFYCFSIDKSAAEVFRSRVKNLSHCFSNVVIPKIEYDLDSNGNNHNYAFIECLKELQKFQWKYVVLLQNHDVILRTNAEMVQIFKWLNGTNDIAVRSPIWQRINKKLNWTFAGLNLFKNSSKNVIGVNGFPPKITFAKGMVQSSISREMFKRNVSPEESFLQSLQATDALGVPGGFTHACLDRKVQISTITRKSYWEGKNPSINCQSKKVRHSLCIFGVEDIVKLDTISFLFLNKMMPQFDFGAIVCWHERLFNRSYFETELQKLDSNFYLSLPHVRYHNEKMRNGKVDLKKFKCE